MYIIVDSAARRPLQPYGKLSVMLQPMVTVRDYDTKPRLYISTPLSVLRTGQAHLQVGIILRPKANIQHITHTVLLAPYAFSYKTGVDDLVVHLLVTDKIIEPEVAENVVNLKKIHNVVNAKATKVRNIMKTEKVCRWHCRAYVGHKPPRETNV